MPDPSLASFSTMTSAESATAINIWNQTTRDYGPPRTLHTLFLEQVRRTPQATALLEEARPVSYSELARLAAGVAAALRNSGAGPGTIVAISAERSAALVAGILGCLMTGAAYLPLDPAYPQARLAFKLQDSRATLLLTQRGLLGRLPAFAGNTLLLEEIAPADHAPAPDAAEDGSATAAAAAGVDDAAAYVIYTSG